MTPREFLSRYSNDERLITGEFYPRTPVAIERGDRIGVIMMNMGGPGTLDEIQPFLYNLFMDPVLVDVPVPKAIRDGFCRFVSRKRARKVAEKYRQIGGGSPITRLTIEQAVALQERLNNRFAALSGAMFRTYVAMRYWQPTQEEAIRKMMKDGINKVVLLPLYPQYSRNTTGSALCYLKELENVGEMPACPSSLVGDFATHPLFVQAVSDRIDEALQRFPKPVRDKAHILFSANGALLGERAPRKDPYYDKIKATVDAVMALRLEKEQRPFHIAFQNKVGFGEWQSPSTSARIEELSRRSVKALVVVPITCVTDHINTAYELDIDMRDEAQQAGIQHYEVTNGLNCHPLFIDALAESVWSHVETNGGQGDGLGNGVALNPSDTIRLSSGI